MRDYGKVHVSFWTSSDMRSLSEDGRSLALYLLSCPHGTMVGVFRLPDGYVCEDIQWTPERVAKGFAELSRKGFAYRCETSKWVWICKFLEWNQPENPNQVKAAKKLAVQVPVSCSWVIDFHKKYGELLGTTVPEALNPSETVTQPFRNQEQEQEQDSSMSGKPDYAREARQVLEYLNEKTNHAYEPVDSNITPIKGRLKEYGKDRLIAMIDAKSREWLGTEWEKYLRPDTLFRAGKCASYVGQLGKGNGSIQVDA